MKIALSIILSVIALRDIADLETFTPENSGDSEFVGCLANGPFTRGDLIKADNVLCVEKFEPLPFSDTSITARADQN